MDWRVQPTQKGLRAIEIWPLLIPRIEQRWESRFGREAIAGLRTVLNVVAERQELELPQGLPPTMGLGRAETYPSRIIPAVNKATLPALLS
jgi:hypothetical protein